MQFEQTPPGCFALSPISRELLFILHAVSGDLHRTLEQFQRSKLEICYNKAYFSSAGRCRMLLAVSFVLNPERVSRIRHRQLLGNKEVRWSVLCPLREEDGRRQDPILARFGIISRIKSPNTTMYVSDSQGIRDSVMSACNAHRCSKFKENQRHTNNLLRLRPCLANGHSTTNHITLSAHAPSDPVYPQSPSSNNNGRQPCSLFRMSAANASSGEAQPHASS